MHNLHMKTVAWHNYGGRGGSCPQGQ